MKVAIVLVALLAFSGLAAAQTAYDYLSANNYTLYLNSLNALNVSDVPSDNAAYQTVFGLLNGLPSPENLTVFVPENSVSATLLTADQLLYSIAVSNVYTQSVLFPYGSTSDGTLAYTTFVSSNLKNPFASNYPTPSYVVKIGKTGGNTVTGDPTLGALTIAHADISVSNGLVQIYSGSTLLTPPTTTLETLVTSSIFSSVATEIPAGLTKSGQFSTLNAIQGITFLLPSDAALTTLATNVGPGLLGYLQVYGGAQATADFASILSYHFVVGLPLYTGYLVAAGAKNYTTILEIGEQVQIAPTITGSLTATSFSVDNAAAAFGSGNPPYDVIYSNGVVHLLNGVLVPPSVTLYLPKIILGVGATSLYSYINVTGLITALNTPTIYTIFAPTNAAFQAALTAYPILGTNLTVLTDVLKLHAIAGTIEADGTYTTVQGTTITLSGTTTGTISVTGSTTTATTSSFSIAQNGVVFPINNVLLPAYLAPIKAGSTPTPTSRTGSGFALSVSLATVAISAFVAMLRL